MNWAEDVRENSDLYSFTRQVQIFNLFLSMWKIRHHYQGEILFFLVRQANSNIRRIPFRPTNMPHIKVQNIREYLVPRDHTAPKLR